MECVWLAPVGLICTLGCGGEAIVSETSSGGAAADASVSDVADDARRTDTGDDSQGIDAPLDCGADILPNDYVLGTNIEPLHPEENIDDYLISGTLVYKGPITEPLASNPLFDREIRVAHDGSESTLQYYLPAGLELPVEIGNPYEVTYRIRSGFEGYAVGVIIKRPTSGLHPLLFVGDTGTYGRAFDPDEPLMSPLRITTESEPLCPTEPDTECAGTIYRDMMVFDSSTGGMTTAIRLAQGRSGQLSVFGTSFTVVNLASTRIQPTCPDASGGQVSYFAGILQAE